MTDDNTPTERRGPGRPRVPEVIERDEKVLSQVQAAGPDGVQVKVVAEALGSPKNAVYLSLWRLRRDGRVKYERNGAKRVWQVN